MRVLPLDLIRDGTAREQARRVCRGILFGCRSHGFHSVLNLLCLVLTHLPSFEQILARNGANEHFIVAPADVLTNILVNMAIGSGVEDLQEAVLEAPQNAPADADGPQ